MAPSLFNRRARDDVRESVRVQARRVLPAPT